KPQRANAGGPRVRGRRFLQEPQADIYDLIGTSPRKLAGISRIKLGMPWAIPSVFWRLVRKRSHHIFVTRVKEEMGTGPEIGIDGYSHPQIRDPPHRYVRGRGLEFQISQGSSPIRLLWPTD